MSHSHHEGINAKVHTQLNSIKIRCKHESGWWWGVVGGVGLVIHRGAGRTADGVEVGLLGGRRRRGGEVLASNWATEFPHLTQQGSVCGPTLRVFCQHQLCDIYSLLLHVPGQPLDTAPATLGLRSPGVQSPIYQQNPMADSVTGASAGGVIGGGRHCDK